MQKELVPRVDENDNLLGLVDRKDAYLNGWIHRGVHAVVLNNKGQYLVPQRSASKSTWPEHYDLGLAETVKPNETYIDALKRGLHEELGINDYSNCSLIREQYTQEYFWQDYKIFGMLCLYVIVIGDEPAYDDGEVQKSQWMSKEEVSSLLGEKANQCTPWLIADWNYYIS
jgi:isopentenyldiphosphate isomerase